MTTAGGGSGAGATGCGADATTGSGAAIGGGLTPLIAAAAMGWSNGATWPISLLLVLLGIGTLVAVLQTDDRAGRDLSKG